MAETDELRKLEAAATPGPWGTVENWESGDGIFIEAGSHPDSVTVALVYPTYSPEAKPQNAELICALRNSAPSLIAEIESLRKRLDAAEGVVKAARTLNTASPQFGMLRDALAAYDSALSTEGR